MASSIVPTVLAPRAGKGFETELQENIGVLQQSLSLCQDVCFSEGGGAEEASSRLVKGCFLFYNWDYLVHVSQLHLVFYATTVGRSSHPGNKILTVTLGFRYPCEVGAA